MVKFNFNYKGKRILLDVEECISIFQKARGLMFRKKSKPLLFIFYKKNRSAIHSYFCVPFVAIWFDNKKIIDVKYVRPWRTYIKPKNKFNKFLEIPVGNKEFGLFSDEFRKI